MPKLTCEQTEIRTLKSFVMAELGHLAKADDAQLALYCLEMANLFHGEASKLHAQERRRHLVAPVSLPVSKKTALIMDNDGSIPDLLGLLLAKLGIAAEIARSGQEGVEKLSRGEFDVLFIDIVLLGGLSIIERLRIKEQDADNRKLVIVVSSSGLRDESLAAGADDYVPKPIGLNTIRTLLTKWNLLPAEA